jgi:hypothetical protein
VGCRYVPKTSVIGTLRVVCSEAWFSSLEVFQKPYRNQNPSTPQRSYIFGQAWGSGVHKTVASVIAIAESFVWLHIHPTSQDVVLRHEACRALEAILTLLGGRSMHDPANEFRRIPLPRTPVNKRLIEQGIRRFITDSLPCVPLLGVSSTHFENTSFQPTHHNQQRKHVVLRLLAEGSVVVVVLALGGWGMWNLGSYTLVSQSDSLTAERDPIYVGGCPVPAPLEKSSARGGVGEGRGCSKEGSTHPITSRQPGVGLSGQAHGAERQRDGSVPPRTSQNSSSTHSG